MNVLVVGAGRGIGLEFVRQYRAAGDHVTATARSEESLQALSALGAQAMALDVASAESASRLAWQIEGTTFDLVKSVADMRRVIASLTPADNGRFLNHDGSPIAW